MFKKRFLIYSLLFSAISFPVFCNSCLEEINSRVMGRSILYLASCGLIDDDMSQVRTFLDKHPAIATIDLSDNELGDEGVIHIADLSRLKVVSLGKNHIGPRGARALAKSESLITINLADNVIDAAGAKALAKSKSVRELYLNNNPVGVAGARALAENSNLRLLYVRNTNIDNEGARALIETSIETMDLSSNHLDKEALNVANVPTGKRHIYLWNNDIDKEGARIVATWLRDNLHVSLAYNPIGNEGVLELAKKSDVLQVGGVGLDANGVAALVELNKHFVVLGLDDNAIGNEGAFYLGQLDVYNLSIDNIGINAEGARVLAQGLQNTSAITWLSLRSNVIGDDGIAAIARLDSLYRLDASATGMSDDGAIALANGSITDLFLSNNMIADQGAIAIAAMPSLEILEINNNQIGMAGITALKANPDLRWEAYGNPGYEQTLSKASH